MNVFADKIPDFSKLAAFGFEKSGDKYIYATDISDGQFEMRVEISAAGGVATQVTDKATGEPYVLHLVEEAAGAFVGSVRESYRRILAEISEKCFEKDAFKEDCARKAVEYAKEKYGGELEFLWEKFPTDAVLRRADNKKWYAAFMTVPRRKLGLDSDGTVEIVDLRADPEILPKTVDNKKYFPGYHMNKKHWITVCLDGSADLGEICRLMDCSYELAGKQ